MVGQRLDLAAGLGRLDHHRRAGFAALEDDGAQFAHHLFHPVQPGGGAFVQRRLVQRGLGEREAAGGKRRVPRRGQGGEAAMEDHGSHRLARPLGDGGVAVAVVGLGVLARAGVDGPLLAVGDRFDAAARDAVTH